VPLSAAERRTYTCGSNLRRAKCLNGDVVTITKKIFLETNSLYSLGPRLENVDLAQLQDLRNNLRFELLVAETSWLEYLRHRRRELADCLARNQQNRSMLEKHGQSIQLFEQSQEHIAKSLDTVDDRYNKKASDLGLTVVSLPVIDVRLLLEMSLAGDPPFEYSQSESGEKTKEKGFRDATIMFTILEAIRGRDDVVIVTADGLLKRGIEKRAKEYQTNPRIVASIAAATVAVTDEVLQSYMELLKEEGREAIALLLRYREQIVAGVGEIRELSEINLGQGALASGFYGTERERLDIERVLSLDFAEIDSAVWKDRNEPVSRILFKIHCTARVMASPQRFFWPAGSAFDIGGEKRQTPFWDRNNREQPSEREVPVLLYGEARFEKVDGDWQLTSMRVERSLSEEWVEPRSG
jgi:PIN domain